MLPVRPAVNTGFGGKGAVLQQASQNAVKHSLRHLFAYVSSRLHELHAMTRRSLQVNKLGAQLTSTDESLRYKGTLLLAKVIHHAPCLTPDQMPLWTCCCIFACSLSGRL